MSKLRYKPAGPARVGSSGQTLDQVFAAEEQQAPARSLANAARLKAAHEHLDRMFADAEGEQIAGRKFWGKIKLVIPFQDGSAQDIQASKKATDRVAGGR